MRAWMLVVVGCLMGCGATGAAGQAGVGSGTTAEAGTSEAGAPVSASAGAATPGGQALAVAGGARGKRWMSAAPLSHSVLSGGGGETFVGVWVDVPADAAGDHGRPPMALSLVIDASGSMAGAKIRHARMAATQMVESLGDDDIVSVFAFDHVVRQLTPPMPLSADNRRRILRSISELRDGGQTALFGAVRAGQQALRTAPASHPIRRVVVVSDGLANVGPSAPEDFAKLATAGAEAQVQVSAIGVGLDYDEHTLGALAMHSEGRMYHLEQPEQMAAILQQELQLLSRTVASGAFVELTPAPGVTLRAPKDGRAQQLGRRLLLPLGTLYAGQERELLVPALLPTAGQGKHPLADLRLVYDRHGTDRTDSESLSLQYGLSADVHAVEASYDGRVEALVAALHAAEQQQRAATLLNAGDHEQAADALEEAESQLAIAVQRAPEKKKGKLRALKSRAGRKKQRARAARSPKAQRAEALSNYDDALEMKGY